MDVGQAAVATGGGTGPDTDSLTTSSSSEDWTMLETTAGAADPVTMAANLNTLKPDNGTEEGRKKRNDSYRSNGSVDDSSDGISVISESDANHEKMTAYGGHILDDEADRHQPTVHFVGDIPLKPMPYEPLTPPFSPSDVQLLPEEEPEDSGDEDEQNRTMQIQSTADKSVETVHALVEHRHEPVSNVSWILFGVVATAMAAVLLGNSMRLQNRVDEINFEHEKRISELELENNILKNEMKQLRHLYTRSELDEQVQQAEDAWVEVQREQYDGEQTAEAEMPPAVAEPEEPPVRKVPPQDAGIRRKVVWSGDDDGPMLIVDKDYVLPSFCYKQDSAVQDDLFAEYSAKYCDVKKRKVEAKQRKAEMKHRKAAGREEDYGKYIRQKAGKDAEKPTGQVKPVSPFNIDYQKAFEAIKSEGNVIVEALSSILDLSPDPEETLGDSADNDVPPVDSQPVSNSADSSRTEQEGSARSTPSQERQKHDDRGHRKDGYDGKGFEGSGGKQRSDYQKRKDYREGNGQHKEQRQDSGKYVKEEKRRDEKRYDNGSGRRYDRKDSKEQRRNGNEQEYQKKADYQHNVSEEQRFKKRNDDLADNGRQEGAAQHPEQGSGERKYKKHDNGRENRQKDNHHKKQNDHDADDDHQKKKHHDRDDDHHKKHHDEDERHQKRNHHHDRNNRSDEHRDSQKKKHHDDDDHHKKKHHNRGDDDDDHHKKRHHDRDDDDDDHHKKKHHDRDRDNGHHDRREKSQPDHHRKQRYDNDDERHKHEDHEDRDHKEQHRKDRDHDHDQQRRKHKQDGDSGHDWHEKRHKGREEFREKNFKKDRDWHEQMMQGREEAREDNRQKMVQDSNWYLERGNQREEERTVQQGA